MKKSAFLLIALFCVGMLSVVPLKANAVNNTTLSILCGNTSITDNGGFTICEAYVQNTTNTALTGTVTWTSTGAGFFYSYPSIALTSVCTLSFSGSSHNYVCAIEYQSYTTLVGAITITASYGGDTNNYPSYGTITIQLTSTASALTTTYVICGATTIVNTGGYDGCTATVVGGIAPNGNVTWSANSPGSFTPNTCQLSSRTCSAAFISASTQVGVITITAYYTGNYENDPSVGTITIAITSVSQAPSFFDSFETYSLLSSTNLYQPSNNQGWVLTTCSGATGLVVDQTESGYNLLPFAGTLMYRIYNPCGSSQTAYVSMKFIATSNTVSVSSLTYLINSNTVSSIGTNASLNDLDTQSAVGSWSSLAGTFASSIGDITTLNVVCKSASSGPGYCFFDNVELVGAVAYNHPSNFQMVDSTNKNQLFNLFAYGGSDSSISVNYTGANKAFSAGNVTAPDLNLPYTYANSSLVTLKVADYQRTLIPQNVANNTMYLDPPSSVFAYTLEFINVFTPTASSQIYVSSGGYTITSGYLDASSNFATWLVPGQYGIQIKSATATLFNGLVTIPQGSIGATAVPIQVTNDTKVSINDIFTDISQGISVTGNTATSVFTDSQFHTSLVCMTLTNSNLTGTFNDGTLCFSSSSYGNSSGFEVVNGYFGTATGSFTIAPAEANQYVISYSFTNTKYGANTIGPFPVNGGNFFSLTPTAQNNNVIGLSALLSASYEASGTDIIMNIIGIFFVIAFAGLFGPRLSSIGVVLTVFMGLALAYAGWIPLAETYGAGFLAFIAFLGSLAFMKQSERTVQTEV